MQPETRSWDNEIGKFAGVERRRVLKSVGALIGASAMANPLSGLAGSAPQSHSQKPRTEGLGKRLIGFMLPHEQFPVPQLVELGAAAEQAGFDLLAASDHGSFGGTFRARSLSLGPSKR